MNLQDIARRDDGLVRHYAYDDEAVVVADLDQFDASSDPVVDVVEDTVIVVMSDDEQFELEAPATPTAAFMHNGILTIEMEAEA